MKFVSFHYLRNRYTGQMVGYVFEGENDTHIPLFSPVKEGDPFTSTYCLNCKQGRRNHVGPNKQCLFASTTYNPLPQSVINALVQYAKGVGHYSKMESIDVELNPEGIDD